MTTRNAGIYVGVDVAKDKLDIGVLGKKQVQEVSNIEAQVALSRARMQSKIFQLLTPEQQARARELLSQRQQQAPRRGRQG